MWCVKTVSRRAYFYALPYSLVVAPRGEAVVEGGGGAKHVGGVGRHDGGREGGGVVVVDCGEKPEEEKEGKKRLLDEATSENCTSRI